MLIKIIMSVKKMVHHKRSKSSKLAKVGKSTVGMLTKLKTGIVSVMGRLRNTIVNRKKKSTKRTKKSTTHRRK